MTTPDLLALALRCEGAGTADRELDLAIMVALDLRPEWLARSSGEMWIDRSGHNPVIRWADACRRSTGNPSVDDPAKYTASIDAAMTLVEDGQICMMVNAGCEGEKPTWGRASTIVGPPERETADNNLVEAATIPLALCAAALRARAIAAAGGGE